MSETFEYRFEEETLDRSLDPCPQSSAMEVRRVVNYHFEPLGNKGWEVVEVKKNGQLIDVKKPVSRTIPEDDKWEYIAFPLEKDFYYQVIGGYTNPPRSGGYDIGQKWSQHIHSCGWSLIPGIWNDRSINKYDDQKVRLGRFIYKRRSRWRGSDDGDIVFQLESQWDDSLGNFPEGFHKNDSSSKYPIHYHVDSYLRSIVSDVLDLKWQLSERAKQNISTFEAVKAWKKQKKLKINR